MGFLEFLTGRGFKEANEDYLWFDCESFSSADDYHELMEGLQRISKGKLHIESILVEEGAPRKEDVLKKGDPLFDVDFRLVDIRFQLGGKQETIKACCSEWLDPDVIHVLNTLLSERLRLMEQFYGVETGDQSLIVVFGEPALKRELEQVGLWNDLEDLKIEKPDCFNLLNIIG